MATGNTDFFPLGNLKVLLAEDNSINQFLAKATLESWGLAVDVANNGRQALSLHEQGQYDLILMDIQMPGMDGLEATKRIRQLPNRRKAAIPIIALTANGQQDYRDRCLSAGMNAYLAKPYEAHQLFQTMAHALGHPVTVRQPAPAHTGVHGGGRGPLYSLAHIQSLSRGNATIIRHMLRLFQQHTPQHLQQLQQGLQAGDWTQVSEAAHKLKTSIDLMLISSLQEDIRVIELQARQKSPLPLIAPRISKVVLTLEAVLDQMQTAQAGEETRS